MAEKLLHGANVRPLFQKVGGEGMPQGVTTGGLGNACVLHRTLDRLLHGGGGAVVPLDAAASRVFTPPDGREYILPPPLCRRVRGLPFEGLRQRGPSVARLQILLPGRLALSKLPPERGRKGAGQERSAILLPLALPYGDLLVLEVQVFHPQSEGLRKAKAGPIQQVSHEAVWAVHVPEHGFDFRLGEHDRKPLRLPCTIKVGHPVPLGPEHVAMEKQKSIQGLILGRGRDGSLGREVGQVFSDLRFPKRPRMLGAVVLHVADDPAEVGLLGLVGIAFSATGRPDAIQDGRRAIRRRTVHGGRKGDRVVWFDVYSTNLYRGDTLTLVGITLLCGSLRHNTHAVSANCWKASG